MKTSPVCPKPVRSVVILNNSSLASKFITKTPANWLFTKMGADTLKTYLWVNEDKCKSPTKTFSFPFKKIS
ncbi:hypothetical protein ES705_40919 [subsurface metagenome]